MQESNQKDLKSSEKHLFQLINILIILISYGLSSFFIYPELKFHVFLKESFSLMCIYGAVAFWLIDRIDNEAPFRVASMVTACISPILFFNHSPGVALFCILLLVFFEFIIFEYVRGCNLFSELVPVYVICESERDAEYVEELIDNYRILELILLSGEKTSFSALKSLDDLQNWLKKINYIPFFPFPRRLLYFPAQSRNNDNLNKLIEVSSEYSIPLFKVAPSSNPLENALKFFPISLHDFDPSTIQIPDKSALTSSFKGKRIWICYDGRGCIIDLICALSSVSSANITVLCESEKLMIDADLELSRKCPNKNYRIKIIDLVDIQGTIPDILFYNMPIKSFNSEEENLKDAVINNILNTKRLISVAKNRKIPLVFVMSSSRALNINNWIGATLRLGELFVQFADFQGKSSGKFKVIRLPEIALDPSSVLQKIKSSIMINGYANIDLPNSELTPVYFRSDVLLPLLKTIISLMKNTDPTSSVYTIIPSREIDFDTLVKNTCDSLCLRKDKDIQVIHNYKSEAMELDCFLRVAESPEKSAIANVWCTPFPVTNYSSYEFPWTVQEINNMSTRELISTVFQNLNEKIKSPQNLDKKLKTSKTL